MTAVVRSAGSSNSSSVAVTSFSPTMPAGFVAGDLLIGICNAGDGTVPATRPSGSTSLINVADVGVFNIDVVSKVAVGGDVFTWTIGTARKFAGCVIAIQAGTYSTVTPIQGTVGVAQGSTASLTFTTPTSTPGNTDSLIIAAFGQQGAATWSTNNINPTMTELADTTSTGTAPASLGAYRSNAPPAASALSRSGSASLSSANGCSFLLFVNPAPAAAAEWLMRSPQPIEQGNVAGPYAMPVTSSQIF